MKRSVIITFLFAAKLAAGDLSRALAEAVPLQTLNYYNSELGSITAGTDLKEAMTKEEKELLKKEQAAKKQADKKAKKEKKAADKRAKKEEKDADAV